jgi:hypothetical protein
MITNMHFEFDENTKINITELFEENLICVEMDKTTFFLNEKQAKELSNKLEKFLYDEPSYNELSELCDAQHIKIEKLEEENEELNTLLVGARFSRIL